MTDLRRQPTELAGVSRRIAANVGIVLGGSGAVMALNFATSALNARALGADGLGVIALFQATALLVTGLSSLGLQQPVIRLGRQALEDGDPERAGHVVALAFWGDAATAWLAGVLSLAALAVFYDSLDLPVTYLGLAQFYTLVVFFSGTSTANGVFRLFDRFRYLSITQAAGAGLILAASAVFFMLEAPLRWYLIANASITALTAIAQVVLAIGLLRRRGIPLTVRPPAWIGAGIGRELGAYAWTTGATSLIGTLRANGETVLLGLFFGTAPAGIYSVVKQLAGTLNKVSSASSMAVFPEMAALASRREVAAARAVAHRVFRWSLVVGLVTVVLAAALGPAVLGVGFGPGFGSGASALTLLALAATLVFASTPYSMFIQAVISPRRLLLAHVIAFLPYLIAAPLLIRGWGMNGAAVGQVVFAGALLAACWSMHRARAGTDF
jgi:O-antigen/teichoic acid export membrane protein